MALPSSEMKKPLTPPKPTSLLGQKEILAQGKKINETQPKIKPALPPKPDLKLKPKSSVKKPVINSPSVSNNNVNKHNMIEDHEETDSSSLPSRNISKARNSSHHETSVNENNNTLENGRGIFVKVNKIQNNETLNDYSMPSDVSYIGQDDTPDNLTQSYNGLLKNNESSRNITSYEEVETANRKLETTCSNTAIVSMQSFIPNIDIKSRREIFESIISNENEINSKYMTSFLSSKRSSSAQISFSKNVDVHSKNELSSSDFQAKKSFFEKLKQEMLSDGHWSPKENRCVPQHDSNVSSLERKYFSDEQWKTKSLSPGVSVNDDGRRWTLNSQQECLIQNYLKDMYKPKPIPSLINGTDGLVSELNDQLKIINTDQEDNISETKLPDELESDKSNEYKQIVEEEPIYWEIPPIRNKSHNESNTEPPCDSTCQDKRELKDEIKDFPSDLSGLSDSELSDFSWSDTENSSVPNESSSIKTLVKRTLIITDIITNNTNMVSDESNRTQEKTDNSNVRRFSFRKKSRVKRSASDQSRKSTQEDAESIGSNSTESSYTQRLSSFFGSLHKNNKRSSQFYCESSPDQSLDHQDVSDIAYEVEDKVGEHIYSNTPVFAKTRDEKPLTAEEVSEKRNREAFKVAREIMTSEKVFIDVLSLLCKDMKEHCRSDIPESEFARIITPLPDLLHLNEDILKDLENRINNWDSMPKISDIFVKKGPFLKLYSTYIREFEAQCNFFNECRQKYPIFGMKVREFELSDFCKKLSVKDYLLKPVQRIPQYKLLLKLYLSLLEPESVDYKDTVQAVVIVSNVADHANETMKEGENLGKLLQIQSRLGNYEIIKPGRMFIKEGELFKLSRRGLQERFFILLSDCLLYTSYYGTMTGLRVNYELSLNGMRVSLPQTEDYNNEFDIITVTRSFTIRAKSDDERRDWVEALTTAIKVNQDHRLSFPRYELETQISVPEQKLGQIAPVWIPDNRASMCQLCYTLFTVTFRRHHCRACGRVVCADCSVYQAPLQYQKFKTARVCENCYLPLMQEFDDEKNNMADIIKSVLNIEDEKKLKRTVLLLRSNFKIIGVAGNKKYRTDKPQRLIEVSANDSGSQMSGWLYKKSSRRQWKRYWYVLKEQVLYRFKASEDSAAQESHAVLGYSVEKLSEQENLFVFQLKHAGQDPLVFGVDSEKSFNRWVKAMIEGTTLRAL